ncbi:ComEA family DNA-binding protein [Oryzomonas japonica]|uniref:ComEA family DNA-binding protein n=1 Tax=Oryzomonas japonica TaxID=2603858 RepID=UPI001C3F60B7|nr:helix-hairpin-helix domain-containing protein [Oryzomonas japonica]
MEKCLTKGLLILASVTLAFALSLTGVNAAPKDPASAKAKADMKLPAGKKVDLNSASQAELEKLPTVGPATAKKIIAGRPYASAADLAKAGVSAKSIEKLTPLVTAGAASAAPPKTATPKAATTAPKPAKTVQPPPADKNMVWVNPASKVFHRSGSPWYGTTKQGSYMSEADAVKAGYREAKKGSQK